MSATRKSRYRYGLMKVDEPVADSLDTAERPLATTIPLASTTSAPLVLGEDTCGFPGPRHQSIDIHNGSI